MVTNVKSKVLTGVGACLLSVTLLGSVASANGLNGIGSEKAVEETVAQEQVVVEQNVAPQEQQAQLYEATDQQSKADVVGGLTSGIGVTEEDSAKANTFMAPFVSIANYLFALILLIATVLMFLITALDLLYIAVPPVRNLLNPQPQGGGGGMGGGMMGGMQQQAPPSAAMRFISDEAVAAAAVLTGGQSSGGGGGMMGGGMGMGGGGFGGGGFGGGMMGGGMGMGGGGMMGGSPQPQASTKSVLIEYAKKRAMFLVMFGVCAVLFSTLIFTDIGIALGNWIATKLFGLEASIPQ